MFCVLLVGWYRVRFWGFVPAGARKAPWTGRKKGKAKNEKITKSGDCQYILVVQS